MSENRPRRDVLGWVRKAEEDRAMALYLNPDLHPNGICFHCQQCIEKYLKALLVSHDETPERMHDLIALGTESADHVPEVKDIFPDLEFLNPSSVMIRYPDRDADPGEARDAVEAMDHARTVLRSILAVPGDDTTTGAPCAETL